MPDEWLQLTEEDIARAHRLVPGQPRMADIITIRQDELSDVDSPASGAVLTITTEEIAPELSTDVGESELALLEELMFDLVNEARSEHLPRWLGTWELRWHERLARVAREHSEDMLRRNFVAHVSPEGVTAARRIELRGIGYVACGENIGVVYGRDQDRPQSITDIHQAFMKQPRSFTNHRGNLLNPLWTHGAIGVAVSSQGSLVATQNFISAPAARLRGR